ncbi:MAG: tocopherol cyclase family protein [Candidatus Aminicenantes bacterium]|nr:tocopherol cyclase family protein [Candidatus Aminicenantes bacterium]
MIGPKEAWPRVAISPASLYNTFEVPVLKKINALYKPHVFQGAGKKNAYFEGWYYKNVNRDEDTAYAVIPAVAIAKDAGKSHSFIQFFDARNGRSHYFRFPLDAFRAAEKEFAVSIGENYFSREKMRLDIAQDGVAIQADLAFANIVPWPVSLLSPGAMGWYAFVPGMECYHGVLSFNHAIEGHFTVNGVRKEFGGGKGYLEKDWGRSMPTSWIWMQSNHFAEPQLSLFGSIAKIPWLGKHFTGFIFGLYHKQSIHRFATYTGASLRDLAVDENHVTVTIEDSRYGLEIVGERSPGVELVAPKLGEMTTKINESLDAKIEVRFYRKPGREVIFAGSGRNAGLEYVGAIDELVDGFKNRLT